MDFTAPWRWPQWVVAFWLIAKFGIEAGKHGQDRLETSGDRKGLPERHDGFVTLSRNLLTALVLIAGGFFA